MLLFFTFLWGANFILAEIALKEMSPISFSVARFAMGGVAMFGVYYWQCHREGSFRFFGVIEKKDWGRLLLIALIGATLAPWLGIEGLGLTHGARASLWLALGPALSTGFGHLFRTEQMGLWGYTGVVLAGIGTLVLAIDGLQPEQGYWLGDLLLFMALALTVVELHLIKPLAYKYGSAFVVTIRTVVGCILYLLIASPSLVDQPWLNLGPWTWIAILAGGGIGVGLGQWVKVRALHKLGPTQVVLYGNMVPVAALLIAWLSVGENPTLLEIISACFIVGGAILIQVVDEEASRRYRGPGTKGGDGGEKGKGKGTGDSDSKRMEKEKGKEDPYPGPAPGE